MGTNLPRSLLSLLSIVGLHFSTTHGDLIPNVERLAYGYDVFFGYPHTVGEDEGWGVAPIFKLTYNLSCTAGPYLVPDMACGAATKMDISTCGDADGSVRVVRTREDLLDTEMVVSPHIKPRCVTPSLIRDHKHSTRSAHRPTKPTTHKPTTHTTLDRAFPKRDWPSVAEGLDGERHSLNEHFRQNVTTEPRPTFTPKSTSTKYHAIPLKGAQPAKQFPQQTCRAESSGKNKYKKKTV